MAQRVVDGLEVIDVKDRQSHRLARARGACQRLRQEGVEHAAVIQAGQDVGGGQPVQFQLRLLAPLRQAIERPAQVAEFVLAHDVEHADVGAAGADVFHVAVQPPQGTQQALGDEPAEQAGHHGHHGRAQQRAQAHASMRRRRCAPGRTGR
jgi:hypothetical protein